MEFNDFTVHNPAPGVWLLDERSAVTLTLIVGRERALLLDTGFDVAGELPRVVSSITDRPVTLAHTHSHVDHTMGNPFWTEACAHPAELPALREQPWNSHMAFRPLGEGDRLDLGGRALEVLHTPGHSPGCLSFLDRENRQLFVGDTVNTGTVTINKYEGSIEDYARTLDRLYALRDAYDVIYTAHRDWPLSAADLAVLRECAKMAREGRLPTEEFTCSLITPERVEVNLLRRGYKKGKFSVSLEILGPVES